MGGYIIGYLEYKNSCLQVALDDNGDAKAIISVESSTLNSFREQVSPSYIVAQVILTTHNDIVVAWTGEAGRNNPKVLDLIQDAKETLKKYTEE